MEGYSDDKGNLHLVDLENVFIKKNKSVGIAWVNDVVIIETESEILVVKEDRVDGIRDI
jgi:mannose-1-phosphate guanylyltransferase